MALLLDHGKAARDLALACRFVPERRQHRRQRCIAHDLMTAFDIGPFAGHPRRLRQRVQLVHRRLLKSSHRALLCL